MTRTRFPSPLHLEDTGIARDGRQIFRLLDSFQYELGTGLIIEVPAGFETDYASVPRFFWRLLPPWGQHGKAAVLHDFLYRQASGVSKVVADAVFVDAMSSLGVPWWQRMAMFWAVALFGRSSYRWDSQSNVARGHSHIQEPP
jgi:hypothetical protein